MERDETERVRDRESYSDTIFSSCFLQGMGAILYIGPRMIINWTGMDLQRTTPNCKIRNHVTFYH